MTDKARADRPGDPIAANQAAWDEAAAYHRAHAQYQKLLAGFAIPGFSCLDVVATEALEAIGVAGRDVAQICCTNGRELLSIKNRGARRCVGFVFAPSFLAQGRELAAAGGLDCEFVEARVEAIPTAFDGAFDLAVTTIGVYGWMPDIAAFFAVVARLLKPGGRYFAYEEHPIANMLEPKQPGGPVHSYFRQDPFVETGGLDYWGFTPYEAETHYWFVHRLGEIVTAAVRSGLVLESLGEYPHNITSADYDVFEDQPAQLPLSFTLVARKPD